MNLTKNQIYIISTIVILVVAWFLFFRKKPASKIAAKMATPPATPPTTPAAPAESGFGGWAGGWDYTPQMTMNALNGSYNPYESGFVTGVAPFVPPSANKYSSLGTDWLQM